MGDIVLFLLGDIMELNKIYQGHVLDVLRTIPDSYVDTIVTSPPYYNLRKYGSDSYAPIWNNNSDCEHEWTESIKRGVNGGKNSKKLQTKNTNNFQTFDDSLIKECSKCGAVQCELGQEPSAQMFVDHLLEIFDECKRILKPTGSLWVNLGDSYAGSGGKNMRDDIKDRSLIGVPQRFMIGMIDRGWICRNDVIWHKPGGMPRPDKQKLTPDHEHIYHFGYFPFFAKEESYFYKQLVEPLKYMKLNSTPEFGGKKAEGYGNKQYSGNAYTPSKTGVKNMRCIH